MSELLKTLPNGQWNLEKGLCSSCHKDPCECEEESDCMKNMNASYAVDPNSVQMSEKEFLKFSATGSGQWSICKDIKPAKKGR